MNRLWPCGLAIHPMRTLRLLSFAFLIVAILGGCSLLRTGYEQADHLSLWWIDRQLNLNSAQSHWLKSELKALHDWHRETQLPGYAVLLETFSRRSLGDVSVGQVCTDIDSTIEKLDALLIQTVPLWAQLARQLSTSQLAYLRQRFDAEDRRWREEWLDISTDKLLSKRQKEWAERAETFYGRLSDLQKTFIRDAVRRSSWDPQLSWERRLLRQQQALAVLEKIIREKPAQATAEDEIRKLIVRSLRPEDARMAEMQRKLIDEACANLSSLHQLTSPEQRLRARDKLASYERDFRLLAERR